MLQTASLGKVWKPPCLLFLVATFSDVVANLPYFERILSSEEVATGCLDITDLSAFLLPERHVDLGGIYVKEIYVVGCLDARTKPSATS